MLRIGRKRKKKSAWAKEKKFGELSEPRVGRSKGEGWRPFPLPRPLLGSLRSPIFFVFYPVFCLFPPLQSLVPGYIVRTFRFIDAITTRTSKKATGNLISKTTTARASHFFEHFFPFCTITTWKCLILCSMEKVNKRRRSFISLSELEYGPLEFDLI